MDRADWILTDGVIWPGDTGYGDVKRDAPLATAMALREGRILALGSPEDLEGLRGPETADYSLEGGFVMPGFVDAHLHLLAGGLALYRVNLKGVASPEEFRQRVADRTRSTPEGGWILGGEWNQEDWGGPLPDREWLDRAAPDHPVLLLRSDLHMGVANSMALSLAGIDAQTPDPERGRIDRVPETGEPTGILREHALTLVGATVPPPTEGQRRAAIRAAALHCLSHGVTQVHDMGALHTARESWRSFDLLRILREEGQLPFRVLAALPLEDWEEVADLVARDGRGDLRLRWGMVKGFVDGSLGSSTAWFHEPYLNEDSGVGGPITDLDELRSSLIAAVRVGLRPAVHAIGDRANDWILDVFDDLDAVHPDRERRLRVEHAQHLTPEALRKAGELDVVCSVQPLHLIEDGPTTLRNLGPERGAGAFAFRSLEAAGARLAFGSDWTVAPPDPLASIQSAVTRRVRERSGRPAGIWTPNERMDLGRALAAHTSGGAFAGFMENDTGTLEPGKRGDFVVLSKSPFEAGRETLIDEVAVEMTFVDGTLAYRREDALSGTGI